jgi:hypothetical protein
VSALNVPARSDPGGGLPRLVLAASLLVVLVVLVVVVPAVLAIGVEAFELPRRAAVASAGPVLQLRVVGGSAHRRSSTGAGACMAGAALAARCAQRG